MQTIVLYKKPLLSCCIFALLVTSCNQQESASSEIKPKPTSIENVMVLTDTQFANAGIQTGHIEKKVLNNVVEASGTLDVPPQNLVSITPLMGGFLKSTTMLQGTKVNKGDVLAILQNPEYIQLQQDYLDYKSQLEYLKAEYERQQILSKENVSSDKALLQAKTQYKSMLAKWSGLSARLKLIGLNTSKIESGDFENAITIHAPISGYITQVNANIGMFVNTTDVLFRIVDTKHLHAEISVFETDVPAIKKGQKVRFRLANERKERIATVYLIGKEITANRTVRIHCHLMEEDTELLPGMFLTAYIETGTNSVNALPNEAIVNFEGKDYVFMQLKGKNEFKLVEVKKGMSESGFTEILLNKNVTTDALIVTTGAFDLLSQMKNTEEE